MWEYVTVDYDNHGTCSLHFRARRAFGFRSCIIYNLKQMKFDISD